MSNASALFRSLLVYGLCLPLAVFLGYLLANPLDFATVSVVGIVLGVLLIPLLLRWHHPWLIAVWNSTALIFFLPGRPYVWMGLAAASFAISVLQYTLNRRMKFLSAPSLARPLLFLAVVILVTMRFTGGIGLRSFGSETFGGRNYFALLFAIVGYFALTNRQIPPHRAELYIAMFLLGGATIALANLPGLISPAFNFLFLVFPVADLSTLTDQYSVTGPMGDLASRSLGLAGFGSAFAFWLLVRYGLRGVLDTAKPWRLVLFGGFSLISLFGGFRSTVIMLAMILALLFYLERLHHTRLLLPVILIFLVCSGLTVLFAVRLPFSVQRSLTIVPFIRLDPVARMDAESSSEWRLEMWRDLVPQIPQYLVVGKGYSFNAAQRLQTRGGAEEAKFVGNYHNGPLSVILPFGIFGAIGFIWLTVSGLRVVYQNYQFGDPAYQRINTFLFAYFVSKVIYFYTVFGSFHTDLPVWLGLLGFSISLNGGVAKPVVVPRPKIVFNRFRLQPGVRRPIGA
jgi:hypothetical protein